MIKKISQKWMFLIVIGVLILSAIGCSGSGTDPFAKLKPGLSRSDIEKMYKGVTQMNNSQDIVKDYEFLKGFSGSLQFTYNNTDDSLVEALWIYRPSNGNKPKKEELFDKVYEIYSKSGEYTIDYETNEENKQYAKFNRKSGSSISIVREESSGTVAVAYSNPHN